MSVCLSVCLNEWPPVRSSGRLVGWVSTRIAFACVHNWTHMVAKVTKHSSRFPFRFFFCFVLISSWRPSLLFCGHFLFLSVDLSFSMVAEVVVGRNDSQKDRMTAVSGSGSRNHHSPSYPPIREGERRECEYLIKFQLSQFVKYVKSSIIIVGITITYGPGHSICGRARTPDNGQRRSNCIL